MSQAFGQLFGDPGSSSSPTSAPAPAANAAGYDPSAAYGSSTGLLGNSPLGSILQKELAASFAVPAAADAGAAGAADIMPAMTNIAGASSLAAAAPAATAATSSLPAWLLAALPFLA